MTLSRSAGTLSGGESQRIRLATQIGSNLSGVLYILDEPSIGLHQRDNDRLIASLKKMRDLGNTLIVVEHDEDTMREADYLIDVGPGAGVFGERSLQQELQSRWLATANPSRVSTCLANARFRFQQSAVQEMVVLLKLQEPVRTTYKTSQLAFLWANSSQSLEFPVLGNRP